jgi:flagellar hook-associated protein 3 FlgL
MRISTQYLDQQFIASQDAQENAIAATQEQVSSGLEYSSPAEDPIAATQVFGIQSTLSQLTQYGSNITLAQNRLNIESDTLTSITNTLQSVRTLALEGANAGTNPTSDQALATQIAGDLQSVLQLANTQDGTGQYLFGGTETSSAPFVQGAGGVVSYVGAQGQRLQQVGPNSTVADGDSGAAIFGQIPNGNGTFVTAAAAANTGSGVIGANSVTSSSAWQAGSPPYTISFTETGSGVTAPTLQYTVTDSTGATVVPATSYTSGQTISFNGAELTMSGTPNAGDTFSVAPSSSQSVFATLQDLVTALQTPTTQATGGQAPQLNLINRAIEALDQAQSAIGTAQTAVGIRLQTIQTQSSDNSGMTLQLQTAMSNLQDADPVAVATNLSQQIVALQASQESFVKIQGLSLFNYLQ